MAARLQQTHTSSRGLASTVSKGGQQPKTLGLPRPSLPKALPAARAANRDQHRLLRPAEFIARRLLFRLIGRRDFEVIDSLGERLELLLALDNAGRVTQNYEFWLRVHDSHLLSSKIDYRTGSGSHQKLSRERWQLEQLE